MVELKIGLALIVCSIVSTLVYVIIEYIKMENANESKKRLKELLKENKKRVKNNDREI